MPTNPGPSAPRNGNMRATSSTDLTGPRVPPPPNYRPTVGRNASPAPARTQRSNRTNKVEINKLNLVPDISLPALSFSFNKTVVNGGPGYGGVGKALPGSGFQSDEDIRAFSEALRKQARPRAVERALDAEVLYSQLRQIPDIHGSLHGSRARARRVTKHLKRIASAERLISKQAAALYASFTREFETELKAQISRGRSRGGPSRPAIWKS